MKSSEILEAIKGKEERTRAEFEADSIDYESFVNYLKGDLSPNSIVQYGRYLHHIDFDINQDNIENFNELVDELAKERFSRTEGDRNSRNRFKYNIYLALKKYLKATDRKELADKLPDSEDFTKPKSKPQKIRYSKQQIEKILDAAEDEKLRLSIALMFYSGLRTYEVLHLTPEWLEFKEDRIEIEIPSAYAKGRKSDPRPEKTYLTNRFEQDLKNYIKDLHDFEGSYQEFYTKSVSEDRFQPAFKFKDERENDFLDMAEERYIFNKKLQETTEKTGINQAEEISAHKLRKSFIHHVYDKIQDLNRTAHLARHRNPQVTARNYLKLDEQEKRRDYQKVF